MEFDAEEREIETQYNRRIQQSELFISGDVDLAGRLPVGKRNR